VSSIFHRGLEKALDQIEAERGQTSEAALEAERSLRGLTPNDSAKKERDVRRVVMREKRQTAWRRLSLNERDVLTVLSAICKVEPCFRPFPSPLPPPPPPLNFLNKICSYSPLWLLQGDSLVWIHPPPPLLPSPYHHFKSHTMKRCQLAWRHLSVEERDVIPILSANTLTARRSTPILDGSSDLAHALDPGSPENMATPGMGGAQKKGPGLLRQRSWELNHTAATGRLQMILWMHVLCSIKLPRET